MDHQRERDHALIPLRPSPTYVQGPSNIPNRGLVLWFDGTRSTPGLNNNDAVSTATNFAPSDNTMTAVSPGRPVYQSSQFTNKGSLAFPSGDGGVDHFRISRVRLDNGFSCFITFKSDGVTLDSTAGTTGNVPMTLIGDSLSTFVMAFGITGNQIAYSYKTQSGFSTMSTAVLSLMNGNVHTIAASHNPSTGDVNLYADGVLVTSGVKTYDANLTGFDRVGVGNGNTDGFIGVLAEVLVWNNTIDTGTVSALHARSAAYWT